MMEGISWLAEGSAPWLPTPGATRLARHLGWGLLLAWVGWFGTAGWSSRLPSRGRAALALLMGLSALVPGPWGPTYWLGLSFQSPSLTSMAWSSIALVRAWRAPPAVLANQARWTAVAWSGGGVLAGWLLLLDTLALLPAFFYPMGYGQGALWLSMAVGLLMYGMAAARAMAGWLLLVLAVFAVTRLPTGNLWDALLDPWLWLVAHGVLLKGLVRALRGRFVKA